MYLKNDGVNKFRQIINRNKQAALQYHSSSGVVHISRYQPVYTGWAKSLWYL